jgi:hypothetical protein
MPVTFKSYLNFFLALLILFFAGAFFKVFSQDSAGNVSQTSSIIIPKLPQPGKGGILLGQNHYYTVTFRGNGEAIVLSKMVITNPNDTTMYEFSFEAPNVNISELTLLQQKLPESCLEYAYPSIYPTPTPSRIIYATPTPGIMMPDYYTQPYCVRYQSADYINYYGGGTAEYQRVKFNQEGSLYRLQLPYPVEPNGSSAIILSFAAHGYVKNSLGLMEFNFETLKVPSRVSLTRVAVDVDSDLYLKGKQSQVNYNTGGMTNLSIPTLGSYGEKSAELDRSIGSIGTYGALVKEAKNLAPNESFTVRGEYSKSSLRLYLSSVLTGILVIVLICIGLFLALKFLRTRMLKKQAENKTQDANNVQIKNIPLIQETALGLLSAFLVMVVTLGFNTLSQSGIFYNSYAFPLMYMVILLTGLLLYVLALFGPAVFYASKKGWRSLIVIIIAEVLWLALFIVLYLLLFQNVLTPPDRVIRM